MDGFPGLSIASQAFAIFFVDLASRKSALFIPILLRRSVSSDVSFVILCSYGDHVGSGPCRINVFIFVSFGAWGNFHDVVPTRRYWRRFSSAVSSWKFGAIVSGKSIGIFTIGVGLGYVGGLLINSHLDPY